MARTTRAASPRYVYAIVASCIVIACLPCALILSCAGIFFIPVSTFFSVPQAQFTLYFSVVNLSMMLTLPIWGKLFGRLNLRIALSAAVIFSGTGCFCMGLCQALWQFYLCGAFMGAGLAPLLYLAIPTLINAWCVQKVGFFVGLCMAFTGIGGVIFNPIGTALIHLGDEGWRVAYCVFGLIILIGTLPFTLFVIRTTPAEIGLLPYGSSTNTDCVQEEPAGISAAQALRKPAFFALSAFCGISTLNQTIYQFLPGYAQSFSTSMPAIAAASGIVASAAMAGQALGKVALGLVNDHSVAGGVSMGVGAGALGVALMWFLPSVLVLLLGGAFLFGVAYAMTTVQTPLLVRTVFGGSDYPAIYSRVSMVGSLMGTVASTLWSLVVDSAGGYPLLFSIGYVCMALCLVLALFALKHRCI